MRRLRPPAYTQGWLPETVLSLPADLGQRTARPGAGKAERKTKRRWEDALNTCRYCTVYLWKHHLVGYTTGVTEKGRIYAASGFYYLEPGPTEETLAKFGGRLRDMNVYQPGFDKEWVKRFKAMILAVERPMAGTRLNWDGSL